MEYQHQNRLQEVQKQLQELVAQMETITSPPEEKNGIDRILHRLDELERVVVNQAPQDLTEEFEEQAFLIVVMVSIMFLSSVYVAYILLENLLRNRKFRGVQYCSSISSSIKTPKIPRDPSLNIPVVDL
jgi:short-subunit dehydrogenase involved in D-alanine esterification of teichoic acids